MQKLIFFLSLVLFSTFSFSQEAGEYQVIKERKSNQYSSIPSFVKYNTENLPKLSDLKSLFNGYWNNSEGFDFLKVGEEVDQFGYTHLKFKQTFKGIPIEFAELIVHSKAGLIYSWNGSVLDDIPAEFGSLLSEEEALNMAMKFINAESYKWEVPEEEQHLKMEQDDENTTYYPKGELRYVSSSTNIRALELRKAFKYKVYAHEPISHIEIYIDANSGEVLFTNNLIHTGNVKGSATTGYSGVQTINTDSVNSTLYTLNQTVSGNGINTYDMNGGNNYNTATDFTDTDNDWNNTANDDHYATDAHWGAEMTYAFLDSMFDRNSIDDAGFALNSYIHTGFLLGNASWDGTRMSYGDGAGTNTPLTSLDIAGHEIAHGLTSFSADLIYESESGALNESFSDIFGTAIEFFARPSRANWTIGEDIGRSLRSMKDPNLYGDPDTRGGTNWLDVEDCVPSTQNDRCGVHINSGVQNFWFYLLVEGGTGTNDNGDTYSVTGISIDSAIAIAYRNLTVYLGRSSNYDDARFYSIESAIDLFGACSKEVEAVTNAWHAVGVGDAYVEGVISDFTTPDSVSCFTPHNVQFVNESNNPVTYKWFFGDGDSSVLRNPIHAYNSYGKFDVQLIVDGGSCGIDTLVRKDFVNIDTANPCIVILKNGFNDTQTSCSGKVFDSGGPDDDYGNNEVSVLTIAPFNSASVELDFISFNVEGRRGGCGQDKLEIFDGPTVKSPLIGEYCNFNDIPQKVNSTRGFVTIRFSSDEDTPLSGFEMNWECKYPTTTPVVDFNLSVDSTCTGVIDFTDFSSQVPTAWNWDFGDGIVSVSQNPVHTYIKNGSFNVKLVASNSFGSDSLVKQAVVYVSRPDKPVVFSDTACYDSMAVISVSGMGTLRWFDSEVGGKNVFIGDRLVIDSLKNDSTFWVEDFLEQPIQNVGPATNNVNGGRYFSNDRYLVFDVSKRITLKSVFVYPNSRAFRTIELRDENGFVLESKDVFIRTSTPQRIDLDFTIEPGVDYQLGANVENGGPDLWRDNSGVNYPYDIENLISIKNSSVGSQFYYFFYDWEIKELDCVSVRSKVTVEFDTLCSKVGLSELDLNSRFITYPNPVNSELLIDVSKLSNIESLELMDISGKQISVTFQITSPQKRSLNVRDLSNGIYFIRLITREGAITRKIIVSH